MKKILIVEDDASSAKILEHHLKTYLKNHNISEYMIEFASNGFEAFGMYYKLKFDLIFLDVQMPKCNGIDFLTMLKDSLSKDEKLPIISMITGYGDEKHINLFKQKGANSFLIKPYNKDSIYIIFDHYFKPKNLVPATNDVSSDEDDLFEFDFDFEDDFVTEEETTIINEANNAHIHLSVEDFLSDYDNIEFLLEDIEDVDELMDDLILNLDPDILESSIDEINQCLSRYATFCNSLSTFGELSSAISLLKNKINNSKFSSVDDKKILYFTEIIRGTLEDLQNWKNYVFVEKTAKDVNYINASILSNSIQIQNIA